MSLVFLFQLQLSEVIARARRYHEEVTGKKGQVSLFVALVFFPLFRNVQTSTFSQVMEGRMAPETYEAKLEAAGVPSEKPDVKQFIDNMTYDR